MTNKQLAVIGGIIIPIIGIGVSLYTSSNRTNNSPKLAIINGDIELGSIQNSNVAIGNSGPVNQNLTVNSYPKPKPLLLITEPSKQEDDGLYHTKINIGFGVVVGAQEPKLISFSAPPEITCSPHSDGGKGFMVIGPLAGLMQYSWKTECVSESPLSEDNSPRFSYELQP